MYNKLIRDFSSKHLIENDFLYICADQNSAIDWKELETILVNQGIYTPKPLEFMDIILCSTKVHINGYSTEEKHLIQIADIFAGMAKSSFENYDAYEQWLNFEQEIPFENIAECSNREFYRFPIYKMVDDWAKKNKFKISLKSKRGFVSYNPNAPVNFWLYTPQHKNDKAPTRFN